MLALAAEQRRATRTTPTSATHSTSSSGSRRCPTSRPGSRVGDPADRVGTSSARRWPCASWGRPSMCTAAAGTWSSLTTSARRPSPSRSPAGPSSATGCTWVWSGWTGRRCPSRWATWSSWASCSKRWEAGGHPHRPPRPTTTGRTGSGRLTTCPAAAARLEAWRKATGQSEQPLGDEGDDPALDAVRRALDDDLDTPAALAALDDLASRGLPVDRGAQLLGITL